MDIRSFKSKARNTWIREQSAVVAAVRTVYLALVLWLAAVFCMGCSCLAAQTPSSVRIHIDYSSDWWGTYVSEYRDRNSGTYPSWETDTSKPFYGTGTNFIAVNNPQKGTEWKVSASVKKMNADSRLISISLETPEGQVIIKNGATNSTVSVEWVWNTEVFVLPIPGFPGEAILVGILFAASGAMIVRAKHHDRRRKRQPQTANHKCSAEARGSVAAGFYTYKHSPHFQPLWLMEIVSSWRFRASKRLDV